MKRISVCCLVLGFLAAQATAYLVHEEPEEEIDDGTRGKRQQNDVAVIGNIFNVPITAIKETKAEETLSTLKSDSIDNVSEVPKPETKPDAWTLLIKNKQRSLGGEVSSASRDGQGSGETDGKDEPRRSSPAEELERRRRVEVKRLFDIQREQQRIYNEQLRRRRFELVLQHNRRMQEQILEAERRPHSHFYRDPYGFNGLRTLIVGPRGVFNGHSGHGDGHVYQFFDPEKPLHFGAKKQQRDNRSEEPRVQPQNQESSPGKSASTLGGTSTTTTTTVKPSSSSSSTTTTTTTTIASTSSSSSSSTASTPTHYYEVHEVVDEGTNTFTWPNWFGIINHVGKVPEPLSTRAHDNIQPKKVKVKHNHQLPLESKILLGDENDYKSKYAQARKNYNAPEAERTGNEIDGDLDSSDERLTLIERGEKILLPNK